MKYSDIALKLLITQENLKGKGETEQTNIEYWKKGKLTNAKFWKKNFNKNSFEVEFNEQENLLNQFNLLNKLLKAENDYNQDELEESKEHYEKALKPFKKLFESISGEDGGIICCFDPDWPKINPKVENGSEKPYLFFYKGDLSLLSDLNNNIAVIGLINPEPEIIEREKKLVAQLVNQDLIIVSGLAKGCDAIAHETTLEENGKTIAILPSPLHAISPAENRGLAQQIIEKKGLLITEYYKELNNDKYAVINRLIDRDRLQAMFAKAVILIASYRKGGGDSGSRHAMEKAKSYGLERYVLYNKQTDSNNLQFGLNEDYVNGKSVQILTQKSIEEIKNKPHPMFAQSQQGDLFC